MTTSRYARCEKRTYHAPDGSVVRYLQPRTCPPGGSLPERTAVAVESSELFRLDLVTARTMHDPLLFWRVADANDAMDPFGLVAVAGRSVRIPEPSGS